MSGGKQTYAWHALKRLSKAQSMATTRLPQNANLTRDIDFAKEIDLAQDLYLNHRSQIAHHDSV